MDNTVIVAGGGFAGVSAALAAKYLGADVTLLERTDMLLGTGLVGGIMRNNGRFTAAEEAIAMGFSELFQVINSNCRHQNISFPGHAHASLYDIAKLEPAIRSLLEKSGVSIRFLSRARDVHMKNGCIEYIVTDAGEHIAGNVFLDATGTAGPMNHCRQHGNGCAMCVLRCPSFGGRISLAAKAGVREMICLRPDGAFGAMSGSCKLFKESLSGEIQHTLNKNGVCIIPLPAALIREGALERKACQQYALREYEENIVLLDTGHAKLMSPYYPLSALRKVPGLENARYEDPYAGGIGNSIRYMAMCPRDNALRVLGVDNLYCAGEKAGLLVGHTEAIVTGMLAGHNAARQSMGLAPVVLPQSTAIGDAIAYVKHEMRTEQGRMKKYTFSGSCYFERMREKGLYTTDIRAIQKRIQAEGLTNAFQNRV
ncbi:FAD-dependent oxidoreductase [Christensenellaceae bacterium OttesenSCG-928-M15]|nr:FAD-dependent oxidoreductase [Christensenellaceae bacterium OttesenSCG-928-M15]